MKRFKLTRSAACVLGAVLALNVGLTIQPFGMQARAADTLDSIATSYRPVITESIDASGFKHPGVGLTKDVLDSMRTQVLAKKEPWNTYFHQMLLLPAAAKTVTSSNQSSTDPTMPAQDAFNSQSFQSRFIADGLKAYTQALLYVVSGDEVYRANAMRIIRIWSRMDPTRYAYYNDAHIHSGIPLNRMVTAAELLRYTSTQNEALRWTDDDTERFSSNLVMPVIDTFQYSNGHFMNQHTYPLLGAMAGYIFTGNRARYDEAVEWFTVNRSATDQGENGAIKQLFRLVERNDDTGALVDNPIVQHVEMGRDQAHGAGDLTNAHLLARMMLAQNTKVDPVHGTPSQEVGAVGPYEFLNDRILAATEYFAKYMLGYEVPWTPTAAHTDPAGNPTIVYRQLSSSYRGRNTQNLWEHWYYYKYVRGIDVEQTLPHYTRLFSQRVAYNWDGVDGGGDFWLFIPPAAAQGEGANYLVRPVVEPYRQIEDRFSAFDANAVAAQDATARYVEVTATPAGTQIALLGSAHASKNLGIRVRTNGVATMDVFGTTLTLPDTHGQWRYVPVALDSYTALGDLVYFNIKGAGTLVQIDHINVQAGTLLTGPVFGAGPAQLNVVTYAGSDAALSYSFAATDPNADSVTYQIDSKPAGAVFDAATGAFSWKPAQAGTYTFVVTASDGTTVTSRRVQVVVAADRAGALQAAGAGYSSTLAYTSTSRQAYAAASAAAAGALTGATDTEFTTRLAGLSAAVAGLRLLNPSLADGTLDYSTMLLSSTFGNEVPNALDNDPGTFVVYTRAVNLSHILDFGPDFRVSASQFRLQVRMSFPERIGGVAVFGSDDKENWTRLTPGQTSVTEDMQSLSVEDELQGRRWRFLKLQMVAPSSSMLELAELRIVGERHEALNLLSAVSMSSAQQLKNRIVAGNTVKVAFQSTQPINGVAVTVQGQAATVSSADNLNWTATWVANDSVADGPLKLQLTYKSAAGIDAAPVYFTTDGSTLTLAHQKTLIGNLLGVAAVTDSSGRSGADAATHAGNLLDSNLATFTDYRVSGSGSGGYVTFDFKQGGTATVSKVEVLARQDTNFGRVRGVVAQGSNDNASWTTMSGAAASSAEWQTLPVGAPQPYRYVRIYNGNNWFGNLSELRLHGVVESSNKIASVSMSSPQALRNRVTPGSTVTLNFVAKDAINAVSVRINGQPAVVTTSNNASFTASTVLPSGASGPVTLAIAYKLANGRDGAPVSSTTDSSALTVVDESDVIANVADVATLIDSTLDRPAATTLANTRSLFDANMATVSDYRIGSSNSGTGSFITFDFKDSRRAVLTGVELAPRQDGNYARIRGTVVQGSSDNANWTTLTAQAASTLDWQTLPATTVAPFRYIRIVNSNAWFGNLAEVRFHGALANVLPPDVSASVKMNQQGALLNRASGKYAGAVTITNTSGVALNGPLQLKLAGLAGGITLDNASGLHAGAPYLTLAGPLAAGASVNLALTFTNPARATVSYTPALFQGKF